MKKICLSIPEKCVCGFENLKIWGQQVWGKIKVEVRCISCGEILENKSEYDG